MLDQCGGPNVGPFFCAGLVTRNSVSGELSFSGQSKAFRHFSAINSTQHISPLKMRRTHTMNMGGFPEVNYFLTEGCIAKDIDGKTYLYLVNPSKEKEQLQYMYDGKWWYIES